MISSVSGVSFADYTAAIRNGGEQHIQVVFPNQNVTITESHIRLDSVQYEFYMNPETDFALNNAPSAHIYVPLLNFDGSLSSIDFSDEFVVKLGVKVGNSVVYQSIGTFIGIKPEKVLVDQIDLEGYDKMQLFDISAEGFFTNTASPRTISGYFTALCSYVGIQYKSIPAGAVNKNRSFQTHPTMGVGVTCKTILLCLAEAMGCYVRIAKDGKVELVWFGDHTSDYQASRTDIFSINVAEYEVEQINKLQVKVTENDIGVIVPADSTETNCYTIVDNPFLYGDSDSSIRTYATNLYDKIHAIGEYRPMTVEVDGTWLIEPGDIISVETSAGTYEDMRIFNMSMRWNGMATITYECTGNKNRGEMTKANRRLIESAAKYHEMIIDIDQLYSEIGDRTGHTSTITQDIGRIETKIGEIGYGTVYMQPDEPENPTLADIWIQTQNSVTWSEVKSNYTWYDTKDLMWQSLGGIPKMFVYDGTRWQEMYDAAIPMNLETRIEQTEQAITLLATKEELNTTNGQVSTLSSQVSIQADRITNVVEATNAKATTYVQWDDPYDPDDPGKIHIGDVWVRQSEEFSTWNKTKGITWQVAKYKYTWANALGGETYVWQGQKWILTSDRASEIYQQTQIDQTNTRIQLLATEQATIGDQVYANTTLISQNARSILMCATTDGARSAGAVLTNGSYIEIRNDRIVLSSGGQIICTADQIKIGNSNLQSALDGKGDVTDSIQQFYLSNSSTSRSGGEWLDTAPAWVDGKYMWMRTKVTHAGGNVTYMPSSAGTCIAGAKGATGDTGNGVSSVTEYYAINNSTTAPGDSSFSTTVKQPTASNRYLWNYEVIGYTNGGSVTTDKHIAAVYGQAGKGVSSITEKYARSTSNSTEPTSWQNSVPTLTNTYKYLWNYEIVTYSDNTTSETAKRVIGVYGDTGATGATGNGISSVTEYYAINNSTTAPATSAFSTDVVSPTASKRYLWNYEVIGYTNGSSVTTSKHIAAVYGETGNGISSIAEKYARSTSNSTAPQTWSDTVPTLTNTYKYLWNYEIVTYTNGNTSETTKRVIGVYGDKGNTGDAGRGITSVETRYYLHTSATNAPSASWANWSTTMPAYQAGKYYWTWTKTTFSDGTVTDLKLSELGVNAAYDNASDALELAQNLRDGEVNAYYANNIENTGVTIDDTTLTLTAQGNMYIDSGAGMYIRNSNKQNVVVMNNSGIAIASSGKISLDSTASVELISGGASVFKMDSSGIAMGTNGRILLQSGQNTIAQFDRYGITIQSAGFIKLKDSSNNTTMSLSSGGLAVSTGASIVFTASSQTMSINTSGITIYSGATINLSSGGSSVVQLSNTGITVQTGGSLNFGSNNFSVDNGGNVALTGTLRTGNWYFNSSGAMLQTTGTQMMGLGQWGGENVNTHGGVFFSISGDCGNIYLLCRQRGIWGDYKSYGYITYEISNSSAVNSFYAVKTTSNASVNLGKAGYEWSNIYGINIYGTVQSSSSQEVKHDIKPIGNVDDVIRRLTPVRFKYNNDNTDRERLGLIWEDTVDIMPELCFENKGMKSISYTELIPALLKEIQDMRAEIDRLKVTA